MLPHSDGVAEAHAPDGDMFGFPRMHEIMEKNASSTDVIDDLLTELDRFVGAEAEQEDDITMVAIQRSANADYESRPEHSNGHANGQAENLIDGRVLADFSLPSEVGNERAVMDRVEEAVGVLELPPTQLERLKTAVSEATMNAIEHGNEGKPELPVEVKVLASDLDLLVRITDHGGGRDIPEAETPDIEAKLAGLQKPRGWGLFLIKNMVDDMTVTTDSSHHTIELVLRLKGDGDGNDAS
jgi:anti-sigma regulatory factor (Ser/Thr protein kinase)